MGTRTQDLIFTLYGDYILQRGGEAPTASLITLLGCLGTTEQATRSALSRLARKGWLDSRQEGRRSFYTLTDKARRLLEEGAQRIFFPRHDPWNGCWNIVTYSIPEPQGRKRDRLRKRLRWLGFGRLAPGTWISPRDRCAEVRQVVDRLKLHDCVECFSGEYRGFGDNRTLVQRSWDLAQMNAAYAAFIERFEPKLERLRAMQQRDEQIPLSDCFVERFWLVHEYRSFPYVDPNLPPDLLPDDWLGHRSEQVFRAYYDLLTEKAGRFVDETMQIEGQTT